jgi:hypothetical protein
VRGLFFGGGVAGLEMMPEMSADNLLRGFQGVHIIRIRLNWGVIIKKSLAFL